jgi:hypothetical protein
MTLSRALRESCPYPLSDEEVGDMVKAAEKEFSERDPVAAASDKRDSGSEPAVEWDGRPLLHGGVLRSVCAGRGLPLWRRR